MFLELSFLIFSFPLDDTLSKQVGLLMIELQLCIRQPEKALGLITYLQNQCLNGNNTSNIKINMKHGKPIEKEQKEKLPKVHHFHSLTFCCVLILISSISASHDTIDPRHRSIPEEISEMQD